MCDRNDSKSKQIRSNRTAFRYLYPMFINYIQLYTSTFIIIIIIIPHNLYVAAKCFLRLMFRLTPFDVRRNESGRKSTQSDSRQGASGPLARDVTCSPWTWMTTWCVVSVSRCMLYETDVAEVINNPAEQKCYSVM